jgi:hypothetical protein
MKPARLPLPGPRERAEWFKATKPEHQSTTHAEVHRVLTSHKTWLRELIPLVMDYVALDFRHVEDWDTNGVLYWLGTNRGTKVRRTNPAKDLVIRITMSSTRSMAFSSAKDMADRGPQAKGLLSTENTPGSWFIVDLGPSLSLTLTHFTIQHDDDPTGQLRNWRVSGSNDTESWRMLCGPTNDCSLPHGQPRASATWHIPPVVWMVPGASEVSRASQAYRYFNFAQTGPNASGTHSLHCRAIEFYGTVVLNK